MDPEVFRPTPVPLELSEQRKRVERPTLQLSPQNEVLLAQLDKLNLENGRSLVLFRRDVFNHIVKTLIGDNPELGKMLEETDGLPSNIRELAKEHFALLRHVQTERTIDELTGILKRSAFERKARRLLEQAKNEGVPVSAMAIDLNGLKQLNDNFDYNAGDAYLRATGEILKSVVPPRNTNLVGKLLNGDEFASLLVGVEPAEAIAYKKEVESIISRTELEYLKLEDGAMVVKRLHLGSEEAQHMGTGSASIGLAHWDPETNNFPLEEIFEHAKADEGVQKENYYTAHPHIQRRGTVREIVPEDKYHDDGGQGSLPFDDDTQLATVREQLAEA